MAVLGRETAESRSRETSPADIDTTAQRQGTSCSTGFRTAVVGTMVQMTRRQSRCTTILIVTAAVEVSAAMPRTRHMAV